MGYNYFVIYLVCYFPILYHIISSLLTSIRRVKQQHIHVLYNSYIDSAFGKKCSIVNNTVQLTLLWSSIVLYANIDQILPNKLH